MSVLRSSVVALSLLVSLAVSAGAQQRARDQSIFGGGTGRFDQLVTAGGTLGLTSFKSLGPQPGVDPNEANAQLLGQASGQVSYTGDFRYLKADATGGGFTNYFHEPESAWIGRPTLSANATSGYTWHLTPRTDLAAGLGLNLAPTYLSATASPNLFSQGTFNIDPTLVLPPDVTQFQGETLDSQATLSLSHTITKRISLTAGYGLQRRWQFNQAEAFELFSQTGNAGVSVVITRHLNARAGYYAGQSRNGPPGTPTTHTQSGYFAIDYGRGGTLQLTRHTILTFNGGLGAATDTVGSTHYFLTAHARLAHDMAHTWNASLSYDRGIDFSSLFLEPTLTDTVTANVGGLATSRLRLSAVAAYSRGTVGFVSSGHGLVQANAAGIAQTDFTRYFSVGASYGYYYRSIGELVVTPSDLSRHSEGRVLQVFASTWVPIYHRLRRPHATR